MDRAEQHLILQKTEFKGALHLGSLISAQDSTFLKEYNINAILTTASSMKPKLENCKIFQKTLNILDVEQYQIVKHFEESYKFIEENLKHGSVLVHCAAGISRSATIVIAYLMKKFDWSFDQALRFVKEKRNIIRPNPGFIKQLKYYEKKIFNESSCDTQRRQLIDYQIEATQNRSIQINSSLTMNKKKNILLTKGSIFNYNKHNNIRKNSEQNSKNYIKIKQQQQYFSINKKNLEESLKTQKEQQIAEQKKEEIMQLWNQQQQEQRNLKILILSKKKYQIRNSSEKMAFC